MKLSDYIVSFLEERDIKVVFGYIGGMITHLVDSLGKSNRVRYIQTYHEQTAAIAAEGYAIESGKFGVAICTSGPGVTNMMTGIADAYFGSIPVIYITGQVNTYEYKYDKPIRQQGFQEMDVVSLVKPITKYAVMVDNAENFRYELEKAVHIATTGRKGPVVIDLPMNISRAEIEPYELRSYTPEPKSETNINYSEIISLIESAKRPMILLGGGCLGKENKVLIEALLSASCMPVVTSLMGRGTIDETYINYIGMIGSYGNRCANMAISKADLLIALGTRLDTRQTGAMYTSFLRDGKIIHVDIDNNELDNHRLENRIKVNTSVEIFLQHILDKKISYSNYQGWNDWVLSVKDKYNQDREIERFVKNKAPYRLIQELNQVIKEDDVVTVDIGQNQMWTAQTLRMKQGMRFVTSGGLAPMGFSLPVAIGIAFANPQKRIFSINGDGGLHMAIQSLLLISQYNLNVKVIVMNNSSLGMITQFQHLYFDNRMFGTTGNGGYIEPQLNAISKAYRLPYISMNESNIDFFIFMKKGGCLINYRIEGLTVVSPKLEYNETIEKTSPLLGEGEFNATIGKLG